ncbi:MAG TPA: hypothetical protein PKN96_07000 [Flavobacterium sp.]|uniref:hypothetical protein n=1 Tax=Flavobacterium sp. TaxID=239 RepID=UPI002C20BA90|nr:hypothetical protein [Flavobacterium sp.]HNP33024.1 hypothetical protein [Flavobacterium sp.]
MKKPLKEYELVVAQGRRPIWQLIIAAICFTILIYIIYWETILIWKNGFNVSTGNTFPAFGKAFGTLLALGISFSITKTVLIDTDSDLLISRFCVGPFSRDVKSKVPQLEYVSVFLDSKENYEVNLWYVRNKHYRMYDFDKKETAIEFATKVALKLKIDLLDATEKGNSKWIDLPKSQS